jgi:hypothetical protein
VLLKSLKVACALSCRPRPAPSPSQPPSRTLQRIRREAFHYTEKYKKLATKHFGALKAFQKHATATNNIKPSFGPTHDRVKSLNAPREANPQPSPPS